MHGSGKEDDETDESEADESDKIEAVDKSGMINLL